MGRFFDCYIVYFLLAFNLFRIKVIKKIIIIIFKNVITRIDNYLIFNVATKSKMVINIGVFFILLLTRRGSKANGVGAPPARAPRIFGRAMLFFSFLLR